MAVAATLTVAGTAFSGGDVLAAAHERPQGFQLQLDLDDAGSAERIFTALADGGEVTLPLQQTFWAQRFGAVIDRFGIPWAINCGERVQGHQLVDTRRRSPTDYAGEMLDADGLVPGPPQHSYLHPPQGALLASLSCALVRHSAVAARSAACTPAVLLRTEGKGMTINGTS